MKIWITIILLLSAGVAGSCSQWSTPSGATSELTPELREKLIQKAKTCILKNYPEWQKSFSLPVLIVDAREHWAVTFEFPPTMQGGVPVIEIEKNLDEGNPGLPRSVAGDESERYHEVSNDRIYRIPALGVATVRRPLARSFSEEPGDPWLISVPLFERRLTWPPAACTFRVRFWRDRQPRGESL